jgi:hypothetical protein
MNYGDDSLATLEQSGAAPECRMRDADQTQSWFRRMIDNDSPRSYKRARVNGLVDGNPPYKRSALLKAGRADACNVNWGIARSYLEASTGAFYDLVSEAPGSFTFRTSYGTDDQREQWSVLAGKFADLMLAEDPVWDFEEQQSIWNMVLHGCGPLIFEDNDCVLPRATLCGDLKVPEFTPSDTHYWDACGVQVTYYPPELYAFIRDEAAAAATGWDVEYVKSVIINAMDIREQAGIQYDWEFYQAELKNNTLSYYDDSKICKVAYCFWKEFDGRITQAIVERDTASGVFKKNHPGIQYLYQRIGRYSDFHECVHPMYFDHGNGGYHHSVTGLGVKMFSAMEYENRLLCNLCDKAFAPKILFNPTSTEATQKFQMAHFGDYAVMPGGFNPVQTGLAGLMTDGLSMHETIQEVLQSNLSSYRGSVPEQKTGNPVTKFEKQLQAAQQSSLSKTQYNRYYRQRDFLFAEIWRRLTNLNSTDERAKKFQRRCAEAGVPKEAYCRVEYVGATRVAGQGSAFMRKSAIDSLFAIAASLPEDGRANLIRDKIAAEAGQSAVVRYYPDKAQPKPTDQQQEATHWVGDMKQGIPAMVVPSQNPVTFAGTFLKAAVDAVNSLKQGGNPSEVYNFLNLAGPAIAAQLNRFKQDPTRKALYDEMMKQWQQLSQLHQRLGAMMKKREDQQKQQQQKTRGVMTDAQIKQAKARHDIEIKTAKTRAQLQQSQEKHRLKVAQTVQDMQLKDASTAHEIAVNRLKAFQTNGDNGSGDE